MIGLAGRRCTARPVAYDEERDTRASSPDVGSVIRWIDAERCTIEAVGFRDPIVASRARVDALEGEVDRLRAENEALRAGITPVRSPQPVTSTQRVGRAASIAGLGGLVLVAGLLAMLYGPGNLNTGPAIALVGIPLLGFAGVGVLLSRFLVVVPATHVAVLSGRRHLAPDGTERNYRIVRAGRTLRFPIFERVDELPVGPFPFEFEVENVYAKGGRPVRVRLRGRARVSRHEPDIARAVDRFLGRTSEEIAQIARELVQVHVHGVAVERTQEELLHLNDALASSIQARSDEAFDRLGLVLEVLEVVSVEVS